jgi:hypothetical protein
MPQDHSLMPVHEMREAPSVARSAFESGCQRLDYTVRLQTAAGYVVTHMSWSETLRRKMVHAESFLFLKDAREFHDSKGADAGMIVAVREDGSVIGEIPTPRQAAEILARAKESRAALDYDMAHCRSVRLGRGGL